MLLNDLQVEEGFVFHETSLQVNGEMPYVESWGGGQINGAHAVSFILKHTPPKLPDDFLCLYELMCGVQRMCLMPSDDTALARELLTQIIPPKELARSPHLAFILRGLEAIGGR